MGPVFVVQSEGGAVSLSLKDGRSLRTWQPVDCNGTMQVADVLALVDADGAHGGSHVDIVRNVWPHEVDVAQPLQSDVPLSHLAETRPAVLQAWADHGVALDDVYLIVRATPTAPA